MIPVINLDSLLFDHSSHGEKFENRDAPIASLIGGKQLGYSLIVVPPGKRASPFHCHHNNEEMFLILEGEGTLRFGDAEHPVRKGDIIAAPAGGRATAHQLVNTGAAELRYLAVSTMNPVDVIEYPDSGKTSVYVGSPPGGDPERRSFNYRGRLGPRAAYWDGE